MAKATDDQTAAVGVEAQVDAWARAPEAVGVRPRLADDYRQTPANAART